MLRVLLSTNETCLAAKQVFASCVNTDCTSDWIQLGGSHVIYGMFVTCCKPSLPLASKSRIMYRICLKNSTTLYFRNLQQADLFQDRFDSSVIKCIRLLFNSFCSNDGKQVARFRCPFYRTLKWL